MTTLDSFVRVLPKIELHAHLNGCVREVTLFDLAEEQEILLSSHHFGDDCNDDSRHFHNVKPRSLHDCFHVFVEISQCVNNLEALRRITREALEDFALQYVCYLELRSTPKRLKRHQHKPEVATKKEYVETILQVFSEFTEDENKRYEQEVASEIISRPPMIPRLLVSVDRANTIDEAIENVDLTIELFEKEDNEFVVGMDLGGNPTKNDFRDFKDILQRARDAGLKLTIHCGEVPCGESNGECNETLKTAFDEATAILDFAPDRLGHALLLPVSLRPKLDVMRIPVELCPTSNVMTLGLATNFHGHLVEGLKLHPQLQHWLEIDFPFSISTDDSGVFNTNPTKELMLLALSWGIDKEMLRQIQINSVGHCFCSDTVKEKLLHYFSHKSFPLL